MSEEYIEEGINGQWTDWKFEAENYKKICEHLQQENQQLKTLLMQDHHKIHELADVIDEVRKYTNDKLFDDYTYCSYEDLKQNINEILDKVKEKQ